MKDDIRLQICLDCSACVQSAFVLIHLSQQNPSKTLTELKISLIADSFITSAAYRSATSRIAETVFTGLIRNLIIFKKCHFERCVFYVQFEKAVLCYMHDSQMTE